MLSPLYEAVRVAVPEVAGVRVQEPVPEEASDAVQCEEPSVIATEPVGVLPPPCTVTCTGREDPATGELPREVAMTGVPCPIVTMRGAESAGSVLLSTTERPREDEPAVPGVPVTAPVAALRLSPAGRLPPVIFQVMGAVPPTITSGVLSIAVPTVPDRDPEGSVLGFEIVPRGMCCASSPLPDGGVYCTMMEAAWVLPGLPAIVQVPPAPLLTGMLHVPITLGDPTVMVSVPVGGYAGFCEVTLPEKVYASRLRRPKTCIVVGTGRTVRVNCCETGVPEPFAAVMVRAYVPASAASGMPESTPVAGSRVSGAGRLPLAIW